MKNGKRFNVRHAEMVYVGRPEAGPYPRKFTKAKTMLTPQTVQGYVKAEPFRPFRLHLASGRTFDVRHPEMIKILKTGVPMFVPGGLQVLQSGKAGVEEGLPGVAKSIIRYNRESFGD